MGTLNIFFTIGIFFGFCLGVKAASLSSLQAEINTLKAEVDTLKKFNELSTTYCSLHSNGACGPCTCIDDFYLPKKFYCDCQNHQPKRDCKEFYQNGFRINGIYRVTMNNFRTTQVYCEQNGQYGGGWTVIQRRMDGSTNFYRNWEEYKVGFGQLQREFWLGNENIHLLTVQAIYPSGSEALIETQYRYHSPYPRWYIRFSHFSVDGEKSKYMLHVSGGSGHASSYFTTYNNARYFSTYDRDNDGSASSSTSYHCAYSVNYGGWWYNGDGNTCTSDQSRTNLNGLYDKKGQYNWYNRMNLGTFRISFSEIKVRRL